MNKLVSVKQSKKNIELNDDWMDYFEDEELHSIDEENIEHVENLKNITIKIENTCQKEKCINTVLEINQLSEECSNLEKKCILIDYVKSQELFEISDKISEICNKINHLMETIEIYEGVSFKKLEYEELTKVELNLIKLYKKVRSKISQIESDILTGEYKIDQLINKCGICKEKELNCIIRPCCHVCICYTCAETRLKCPLCFKFIDYFDKIYLPSIN